MRGQAGPLLTNISMTYKCKILSVYNSGCIVSLLSVFTATAHVSSVTYIAQIIISSTMTLIMTIMKRSSPFV